MAKKRKNQKNELSTGMAMLGAAVIWYLLDVVSNLPTGNPYTDPTPQVPQIPQLPAELPAVQRPKRRVNAVYVY